VTVELRWCSVVVDKKQQTYTMLKLRYDPTYGRRVRYYPSSAYYFDDTFGPFGDYWPLNYNPVYPYRWPLSLLDLWPTEHHLRKIRVRNNLYSVW
ncbi:hypothetical protein NQ315_007312, partial [Exocentrus adspersus]